MVDFNTPLKTAKGQTLEADDQGTPFMLGDVVVASLNSTWQGDSRDATQKINAFKLSQKIVNGDGYSEMDLKAKEVTAILDAVEHAYPSPLIYGQVAQLIDGDDEPGEK